jgi:sugar phosphate isomerase/epimerase
MTHLLRSCSAAALGLAAAWAVQAQPQIPDEYQTGGFAIGCQAYSFNGYHGRPTGFNGFSLFEAIEKNAQAGGKVIELYPGQSLSPAEPQVKFDHNASPQVLEQVKAKLAQHHTKAVNYGVVGIPKDEAAARKLFDFARTMGLRSITTESDDAIDTIEKLVKEYDISVGFHNHPGSFDKPGYKVWNPYYIAGLVAGRDRRIGAAADTGHWCTSGLKPIECLKILNGRIVSAHLKDKQAFGASHDVPYGEGVADIKACLDELKAQKFQGNIAIEYEYHWENNVPEITRCIDFVRNYGAGK